MNEGMMTDRLSDISSNECEASLDPIDLKPHYLLGPFDDFRIPFMLFSFLP